MASSSLFSLNSPFMHFTALRRSYLKLICV
jgi:hypothetical protein